MLLCARKNCSSGYCEETHSSLSHQSPGTGRIPRAGETSPASRFSRWGNHALFGLLYRVVGVVAWQRFLSRIPAAGEARPVGRLLKVAQRRAKGQDIMALDSFCCPARKGPLAGTPVGLHCAPCGRHFRVVGGIPDFLISEGEHDFIDEPNKTWLDPEIVEARDTAYRLCARELKGMAFCMQEISRRTSAGCRVLEVGTFGTTRGAKRRSWL